MERRTVAPILVNESRVEVFDVTNLLLLNDSLVSAAATVAVYSGTDLGPSDVVGTIVVDTTFNRLYVPLANGVLGCIYQVVVTLVKNNITLGNTHATFCFFLVVIPDAV